MLSVLIVNYFSSSLTARAIDSVLSDQPSAQIIVVDNSNNAAETESLSAALPGGIELIITHNNLGFGRACNLALDRAHGEWIFLLNPDAFVLPGCLERLIETLQRHPRAGAVSPVAQWDEAATFLLPPGQMQSPAWEWLFSLGMRVPPMGRWLSKRFRKWVLNCLNAPNPVSQRMLSGGHMLLRRQAIEAAGGLFDPGFFMYYEDTDLCRRLHAAGFGLLLDPSARLPAGMSGEWLLELSSNPLFMPAAYSTSCAPPCIPLHIGSLLGPGRYWVRVTAPGGKEHLFTWEIPDQTPP
ncbi:MAG: glycosyltransferase family 2 protein [Nitrosomonas sp.]|nr:glycosyltransferase family 2 protein [Nitrosomonas sp.]